MSTQDVISKCKQEQSLEKYIEGYFDRVAVQCMDPLLPDPCRSASQGALPHRGAASGVASEEDLNKYKSYKSRKLALS